MTLGNVGFGVKKYEGKSTLIKIFTLIKLVYCALKLDLYLFFPYNSYTLNLYL